MLTMEEALEAVKSAFLEQGMGRVQMPPKSYLYFPLHGGDLRTMPAYLEKEEATGVKIVNVHAGNPKIGLPTVMALVVLNSPMTGAPLAVMGGTHLTAMRTGAAGGIAATFLARPSSKRVGLMGAGIQARAQLRSLSLLFPLEEVVVSDVSLERARMLETDCRQFLEADYHPTTDPEEACNCDILVTTTPSRQPVVKSDWVSPGTHINAIGADAKGKQELESALLTKAKVVVDDMVQAVHSGEVNVPISQGIFQPDQIYAQIGDLVVGKLPGRTGEDEITIFDSTGLAIQDIATAQRIYLKALNSGRGMKLPLFPDENPKASSTWASSA